MKIKNEFNVKRVFWKSRTIENYCPIGKDYCTYRFEVDMGVGQYYFDYDKLHDFVDAELNGKTHTREEATHILYKKIISELKPISLTVRGINTADNSFIEI